MADSNEKINEMQARLDKLIENQNLFYREINRMRDELQALKSSNQTAESVVSTPISEVSVPPKRATESLPRLPVEVSRTAAKTDYQPTMVIEPPKFTLPTPPKKSSGIEEFVGKNLISLIGIIITVLGVGIGAKYAIDNDYISPPARILLGYAFAGVLLAVAFWLKAKYLNFSAVLLSGALAMMYFLTFFAYSFYELIPQFAAFGLMLAFTVFAVGAAINFNRQVIAHIGLVGAYAVPFLLSNNSGRVGVLFGYMTLINVGILLISIFKYWKSLFYSAFVFSWLIYTTTFLISYRSGTDFRLWFGFALIFYAVFYATFLVYKLRTKQPFSAEIIILIFVNSFIFYGFGYELLDGRSDFKWLLGAFTVANASVNALVALAVRRFSFGERQNFYLALVLAITFITIAVPVQFGSNWITLGWTAETALLFWIGRTKKLPVYEYLAYPLMIFASVSLVNDWQIYLFDTQIITPIFNRRFLTSILFAVALGFITFVNRDKTYAPVRANFAKTLDFIAPTLFLGALYYAFRAEIGVYFYQQKYFDNQAVNSGIFGIQNSDLLNFVWQINYTLLFFTVLSFVNLRTIRSAWLGLINVGLNIVSLLIFLSAGLILLGEMREIYLTQPNISALNVIIRYVSLTFVAAILYAIWLYAKTDTLDVFVSPKTRKSAFDLVFYIAVWWLASSELINLANLFGFGDAYKLGLSIFWGIYSLLMIGLGIFQRRKHLRIGAIVLFAVTLIKLFFYDIADLDTISKTVIFLTLGVLLLVISFLYNKYKDLIFEAETN